MFAARDVFPSGGIFAQECCVEHGNVLYVFTGRQMLIKHDGNQVQDILYGVGQDYVVKMINNEYASSCFVYRDAVSGQILLIAIPPAPIGPVRRRCRSRTASSVI